VLLKSLANPKQNAKAGPIAVAPFSTAFDKLKTKFYPKLLAFAFEILEEYCIPKWIISSIVLFSALQTVSLSLKASMGISIVLLK
jgi:hypothetical protein